MERHGYLLRHAHQQAVERSSVLREFSDRASRYSINLDGHICRTLGRNPLSGGTADVYHGTSILDGTEVAIKTFRCTLLGSRASFERILREVYVWSKLRHENVTRMFGISMEFDSTVSIISEWMPLGNAYTYVQNAKNDPRPLLRDMANGLCYLHNHELGPIVHGDPKGFNVLVSRDRRALLTDFGLTTINVSPSNMAEDPHRPGSYQWMAPELVEGSPTSMASDVWAFGMTTLELFTREIPFFRCSNIESVIHRVVNGKLPPRPTDELTQFRLSDAWWEICTSCWRRDPSCRPTMQGILENVKAAMFQTGSASISPEASTPTEAVKVKTPQQAILDDGVIGGNTTIAKPSRGDAPMKITMETPIYGTAVLETRKLSAARPDAQQSGCPLAPHLGDTRDSDYSTMLVTLRLAALEPNPSGHPERFASLTGLAVQLVERSGKDESVENLVELITLRCAELEFSALGNREPCASLMKLTSILEEKLRAAGMLDCSTASRRALLESTPLDHRSALVGLVDALSKKFWEKRQRATLDLMITLRRGALKLTPPEHPERLATLVNLVNHLDRRYKIAGTLTDLEEIVSLRRVIFECTPLESPDRIMSLANLATCLHERYLRMGVTAELNEAIARAGDALEFCPPELRPSTRECLINCIQLKTKECGIPIRTVTATNSDFTKTIFIIVHETVTTIPLRLLDTETGVLCDRDTQILRFERSAPYNELLLSASAWDSQRLEAEARRMVSKFFGYAMLSHRWGRGEPPLSDVKGTNIYTLPSTDGLAKLQQFCSLALREGLLWAWSDTCCIDKGSSAELQEAIGSMFSWYRQSALTIIYLSDVSDTAAFVNSEWFQRGWTLQELLASPKVLFYMRDWSLYMNDTFSNHKTDNAVLKMLERATGVDDWHLRNFCPGMDDARSRLQWASARRTTKPEDIAYSLFGIFDLHLPVLYGESSEKALGRLLAEIISQSGDISVLDWVGQPSTFHSCFPATLCPYRTVPCVQSIPSNPIGSSDVDKKRISKLYRAIVKLPRPRFINRRLALPSFVYPITAVKLLGTWDSSLRNKYEIHASNLAPIQVTLTVILQKGSAPDFPYALIRPWHPKWFAPGAKNNIEAIRMLNEYKRIASDCIITARAPHQEVSECVFWLRGHTTVEQFFFFAMKTRFPSSPCPWMSCHNSSVFMKGTTPSREIEMSPRSLSKVGVCQSKTIYFTKDSPHHLGWQIASASTHTLFLVASSCVTSKSTSGRLLSRLQRVYANVTTRTSRNGTLAALACWVCLPLLQETVYTADWELKASFC